MRVKRLEIQGFKSFKDKTVIHFDHGITGIVGPNGCGKSNIVDAFFWVMGEQSYKHMRGTSSDDLIFNGSSKYNPLGMAEATLIMDTGVELSGENAASGATVHDVPVHLRAREVSVTRRLYRTGEGEYFINGVPARLKDIHELFMDTGVGAKGYSVIEQGQIGKVVNAKPEDRRLLIEEAAGIAKYKARKKESLRKMEAAQANLSRLNDVVQEIERQLASLERQAQKAQQHRKLKDELLDKEMTWGRRKAQVLRQRLDEIKATKEIFEQELVGLRAELQTSENSIEVDRVEQVGDTKLAEEIQLSIQSLSDELSRERSALELSRRRQTDLETQVLTLDQEKLALQSSLAEENAALEKRIEEARALESAYEAAQIKAQKMDEETRRLRQEAEATRRDLDEAKHSLMKGVQDSSALTSRDASLASRLEGAQSRAQKLSNDLAARSQTLERCQDEAAQAIAAFEALKARRDALAQERRAQAEKVNELERASKEATRSNDESMRALTQSRSKLQSLEELAAAYEGFADGSRAALEFLRENGGSVSAIADAFETAPEFEGALGGWLENRLENLIAPDTSAETAVGAFDRLRLERSGRAAIHVSNGGAVGTYNSIRFASIRELLESAGFEVVGELEKLARITDRLSSDVRAVASRAVQHVCVVRSMSALPTFIRNGQAARLGHWSLVSLDGVALDTDGVLRGGSLENDGASNVLRRKRAISELAEQVRQAEEAHQAAERASEKAKEALELARAGLQTLIAELQELEVQSAALDRDVKQGARTLSEAETQMRALQREIEENAEEIAQATAERASIEDRLSAIVSARTELEARIAEGENLLTARETEVRAHEFELQSLRVEEVSLRERLQGLKREMESSKALIADRERRLSDIQRTLDRAVQERSQFTGGDSSLQQKIEELTVHLSRAREKLSMVKDRIEHSSAKVNAALDRIKELHKTVDEKTGSSTQLALELEKLGSDLAHLIQNLEEKYGPGCLEKPVTSPIQEEMSEPVVTREMTAEEEAALGEEVERLRERIRRLGEVNTMAIEEYEELKKRYDHLLAEKTDLENSIQNLQDAIEHINKTSEDRFKKAFEAINDRFQRLFPIIFGGGGAHLSLVFPEGSTDILEAGVDILAQPPGKKVSNITLLSGGEKALTAVSLIFAIFMVKPSPFCVLDEVDAPLDDSNIGKFNALLREMAAKSQFILITHNKKTMELNDTLYGVTMEEPGVSKMVSIELQ